MPEILGPQKLGPLTPLVGEWEGDVGVDLSYHNKDDDTSETSYFERATFSPIPIQENGQQSMEGLNYKMTAWRHGEEAMDPFHDEVGYLLWDKANGQVMRSVVFGRGIAILAGSDAGPRDRELRFDATPGEPCYGILQNKYLLERAELKGFKSVFSFGDDGSFSYTSDLVLRL
ncbi:MAG TPA: FABP family protein, partial [Segeticoccus sp.]|nr:FABP family protein [Segeticoccus sp.]